MSMCNKCGGSPVEIPDQYPLCRWCFAKEHDIPVINLRHYNNKCYPKEVLTIKPSPPSPYNSSSSSHETKEEYIGKLQDMEDEYNYSLGSLRQEFERQMEELNNDYQKALKLNEELLKQLSHKTEEVIEESKINKEERVKALSELDSIKKELENKDQEKKKNKVLKKKKKWENLSQGKSAVAQKTH